MWLSSVRLWHSALLFILAFICLLVQGQIQRLPPDNFEITFDETLNEFSCVNEQYEDDVVYKWKLDGILNEEFDGKSIIQLDYEVMENIDMLACLASNQMGTSYAFYKLTNDSAIDR